MGTPPLSRPEPTRTGTVPWPDVLAARYRAQGTWDGVALGTRFAEVARRTPEAVCLVDHDTRLTFRDLLGRADAAAARLSGIGLRADDRVVLQLPNCWEFVALTLACLRLGAVPVWAMPQHRRTELSAVVERSAASVLVVPGTHQRFDHEAMAREIVATSATCRVVATTERPSGADTLAVADLLAPPREPASLRSPLDGAPPPGSAVATLLLSGGTTGEPKLVPRTHDDLGYMLRRATAVCRFDPTTVLLAALPVGHGFVNIGPGILGALLAGGRVVMSPSTAPGTALPLVERERVTVTAAVPAVAQRWLQHVITEPGIDLGSLELLQVGAAHLAPELADALAGRFGCTVQQVYGMAEGLLCLTDPLDPVPVAHYTQGRPVSPEDELRVVGPDGHAVAPGEPGLLLTRGPYTPRGYYRAPELDAEHFVEGGWYVTGDVVRLTPEGCVVIVGREKDVINRGGEKVSADEIERFAAVLPGVRQAAAVAMPHPELGEEVCVFVATAEGADVNLDQLWRLMRASGVAHFKLPRRLVVLDALPTVGVGKSDKRALRAAAARLAARSAEPADGQPVRSPAGR